MSEIGKKIGASSQSLGQYKRGEKEPKLSFYLRWKQEFGEDLLKEIETKVYNIPLPDGGVDAYFIKEDEKDPTIKHIMLIQLKNFEKQTVTLDKQAFLMEAILKMMAQQDSQASKIEEKVNAVDQRTKEMESNLTRTLVGVEKLSIRQDSGLKEIARHFSQLKADKTPPSRGAGKKLDQTDGDGQKLGKTRAKRM